MKKLIDLTNPDANDPTERPNALELATAAQKLQDLGERLVKLSDSDLLGIPMDESLSDAVYEARRLDQPKAIERQVQFIGRLMRSLDPAPIEKALELVAQGRGYATQQANVLMGWRERLINEGDAACNALLQEYPSIDRQRLRQLVRQAKKDGIDSKSGRELNKLLRAVLEQP